MPKPYGKMRKLGLIRPESPERAGREYRLPSTPALVTKDDDIPEKWRALVPRIGRKKVLEIVRIEEDGVIGTAPELLFYAYLIRHNIPFEFQSSFRGGRIQKFGVIVDFLLFTLPNGVVAVEVLGEYWHPPSVLIRSDLPKKERLLKSYYGKLKIKEVVWLFETDCYDRGEEAFGAAVQGRSLRGIRGV